MTDTRRILLLTPAESAQGGITNYFQVLKDRLERGENLLLIDSKGGPRQQYLVYYQIRYKVPDNFITNESVEVNEKNIQVLVNDTYAPFGFGYCLGMALRDGPSL